MASSSEVADFHSAAHPPHTSPLPFKMSRKTDVRHKLEKGC